MNVLQLFEKLGQAIIDGHADLPVTVVDGETCWETSEVLISGDSYQSSDGITKTGSNFCIS